MPVPNHSVYKPDDLLAPNQQHQSTEGNTFILAIINKHAASTKQTSNFMHSRTLCQINDLTISLATVAPTARKNDRKVLSIKSFLYYV